VCWPGPAGEWGNWPGRTSPDSSLRAAPPVAARAGSRSTTRGGRGRPLARVFMAHFPLVPVVDEEQLHDPELRENFVERLFFQRRWREFLGQRPDKGQLAAFHDRHRLQILAHSPGHGRWLERLLAAET